MTNNSQPPVTLSPSTLHGMPTSEKGLYGLEFEAESTTPWKLNNGVPKWTWKADGSLRHAGIEFVSRGPLTGEEIEHEVHFVCDLIRKSGTVVENSPRTSVHVHDNCTKDSIRDIIKYVITYLAVEEFMLSMCNDNRRSTPFAVTLKQAPLYPKYIADKLLKDKDYRFFTLFNADNFKYSSVNLCRLRDLGTVEFRSMHGNYNPEQVLTWLLLLRKIKELSKKFSSPDILLDHLYVSGPEAILQEIAMDDGVIMDTLLRHHKDKDNRREVFDDACGSLIPLAYLFDEEHWSKYHEYKPKGFFTKNKPKWLNNNRNDQAAVNQPVDIGGLHADLLIVDDMIEGEENNG